MGKSPSGHGFCPVPGRTLTIPDLTALDHRVLALIAAKDLFGRGGKHCIAKHSELAVQLGCNEASLSQSVARLRECGLIRRFPYKHDRRRWEYAVVYVDEVDRRAMGFDVAPNRSASIDCPETEKGLPAGKRNAPEKERINTSKQSFGTEKPSRNIYSTENHKNKRSTDAATHADHFAWCHRELAMQLGDGDLGKGWVYLQALEDAGKLARLACLMAGNELINNDITNARLEALTLLRSS